MLRFLAALCLALVCVPAPVSAIGDQETAFETRLRTLVALTSPANPNYPDAMLIESTIAELSGASATFRDLLAVLISSPRILTFVSPSKDVQRLHLIGRTRFRVSPNRVVAFVE